MNEIQTKIEALRGLLAHKGLDGALLQSVGSFAWATGGTSTAINVASTNGLGALLITPKQQYVLTNNIEGTRLEGEEQLGKKGWEIYKSNWWEAASPVAELAGGLKLGSDGAVPGMVDISGDLARLRSVLLPVEQERIREVSKLCSAAMDEAIRSIQPGMTEFEIGSRLALAGLRRGVEVIVNLIATDERIFNYRHPTYTNKKMDRYAMMVLCGRRYGLVVSITRLVHFGPLPAEIAKKAEACARVDAAVTAATRPGRTLGEVFADIQAAYAAVGYADDWKLHHQGGPAGYEPREYLGLPGSTDQVSLGQSYAWNPSITGVKSEDTILVGAEGNETMTETAGWPTYEIEVGGKLYKRAKILVV